VQLTDVGYRCKDCIGRVRSSFYTAHTLDYPIAALASLGVAAVAAPIAGLLATSLGFWGFWIAFLVGPAAGGLLAEIIRQVVGRRRGRYLWLIASVGTGVGVIIGNIGLLWWTGLFPLLNLPMLLFLILALSTVYARLR
jgi:MFS family permease